MSHQIFLISLRAAFQNDDAVREELAEAIHRSGGFILMAAGDAGLVAAFDDRRAGFFQQHRAVETCGGLNLNPHGRAADKLRQLFAANVAAQLASRTPAAPAPAEPVEPAVPAEPASAAPDTRSSPRHRPLTWHRPVAPHPADATGVSISLQHNARGTP